MSGQIDTDGSHLTCSIRLAKRLKCPRIIIEVIRLLKLRIEQFRDMSKFKSVCFSFRTEANFLVLSERDPTIRNNVIFSYI